MTSTLTGPESEILDLLTMSPESSGQLIDMLASETVDELVGLAGSVEAGVDRALERLRTLGLVDFSPTYNDWQPTRLGSATAAAVRPD
ncbi:hypothetical protein [Pseudonocardia sp. ICBG1293]|uniref:hypothetical protein n=1 Tax=Pseudonocardia sp. ICBG1293 TaxID=2844382 RepID=UPI001CCF9175|nr:hypothetical protein [Pseudonocardia sp. ICBG1293]